jgi:hypothetical protein
MNERLQLGIIGAGRIGKLHAQNIMHLIPEAKIKILADILAEQDQIKNWAKDLGIPRITTDYRPGNRRGGDLLVDRYPRGFNYCRRPGWQTYFL